MNRLALRTGVLFLSLLLAACGPAATEVAVVPTPTPLPTDIPSPARS